MTPHGLGALSRVIRDHSGVVIGADKLYLLTARLSGLLLEERLGDLDALASRVAAAPDGPLAARVVETMTTNETLFFRDPQTFQHLAHDAVPRLRGCRPAGGRLAIWSAASSTGQEAYSVAIALAETLPAAALGAIGIVATDIARLPLARAEAGLYSPFEVQRGLSPERLARHFRREGEAWRLADEIRARVKFRRFNLLNDPSLLGRFDIVFVRNVLIYFDPPTRQRVLAAIARQLAPDGVLYLGAAETLLGVTDLFVPAGRPGVFSPATGPAANQVRLRPTG